MLHIACLGSRRTVPRTREFGQVLEVENQWFSLADNMTLFMGCQVLDGSEKEE